jgi:hypothetical protein
MFHLNNRLHPNLLKFMDSNPELILRVFDVFEDAAYLLLAKINELFTLAFESIRNLTEMILSFLKSLVQGKEHV